MTQKHMFRYTYAHASAHTFINCTSFLPLLYQKTVQSWPSGGFALKQACSQYKQLQITSLLEFLKIKSIPNTVHDISDPAGFIMIRPYKSVETVSLRKFASLLKTVFTLHCIVKNTCFSSGNESSPWSFSSHAVIFPTNRKIYSFNDFINNVYSLKPHKS